MLRKIGFLCFLVLALPAFANAWTVTAKIGSGKGTVSDGTKTIALGRVGVPSIGYYKQDNLTGLSSQTFTVDPETGYSVSSVILNGVDVTGTVAKDANGTYTVQAVPAGYVSIRNSQSLVAYFKQNLFTVTATQPAAGGRVVLQRCDASGAVYGSSSMSSLNLKPGAYVKVTALPNADYLVTSVADIVVNGQLGDVISKVVQVNASDAFTADFRQRVAVKPDCRISSYLLSPGDTLTVTCTDIPGTTYAVSTSATDGIVTGTNPFFIKFQTSGTFSLTFTATLLGQSFPVTKAGIITIQPHNACTTCHSYRNAVITTAWQTGAHGNASGHTTGTCQRCHATEGAIVGFAAGYTGGYADVLNNADAKAAWTTASTGLTSSNGISCAACHAQDPHNGGNILRAVNTYDTVAKAPVVWDPNGNGQLDQYDVCTGCHTLINNSGALVGNYHDGSSASVERTISDSHYDNAATTAVIEGYNLRKAGATPCADCHNLHKADVAIQEEWAESGHAGKILANKEAALVTNAALYYNVPSGLVPFFRPGSTRTYLEDYKRTTTDAANGTPSANALLKTVGATETTGAAWVHYNWDQTQGTGNRASCEKCHTATGAANYMGAPATYNAANNNFSHLPGWTATTGSGSNELLYCWGCHTDSATGALRNPGAVKADYNFNGSPAIYPDVQASNTCLVCHIGQASGENVTALTATGNDFTNVGFVNSHYMAAGALMYVKGGYVNFVAPQTQVAGTTGTGIVSYGQTMTSDADQTVDVTGSAVAGKLTSTHRKLGMTSIDHNPRPIEFMSGFPDTGGPCVTCHYAKGDVAMGDNGIAEHTLEVGTKALNGICINCHASEVSDTVALKTFIEEQSEPFQATLTLALKVLEDNYNITYNQAAYPYFYDKNATNGAVKDWTRGGALNAAQAEKLMGACFNINLLKRDPAAYVHARTYARRLLYDTIDFLDNKAIDQSVGATALASGMVDANNQPLFVKDTAAYNTAVGADGKTSITTPYGTTTSGMLYILAWSRTTGAWAAYERP
ncbi:hypothetical protein [Geomonas oryzae]|uniref:hypothetical protein n=1 Tax=Geomonas oryzae TaxID=2364273 RepID=UPI00100C2B25|nr:hypothetical protein [Geomonas oryzae]